MFVYKTEKLITFKEKARLDEKSCKEAAISIDTSLVKCMLNHCVKRYK